MKPKKPIAPPEVPPHVFRQVVEQADLAVSITDLQANILYVNPAFTRVSGYAADEALGRNQSMLSHKVTPPAVYRELWQKLSAGESWSGRLVNRRRDGSKYLAELLISPVQGDDGQVAHYLGLHRDVTELHRLECEVGNQKAMIESVVDAAPVVMALLDSANKVVLDNQEYKKLMGDLGMVEPAKVILDAVGNDAGKAIGEPRAGSHAFLNREVRIDRPGGRPARWFSCSGLWVRRDDGDADSFFGRQTGVYLLLVAMEVTEQRAQQERARVAALQAMLAESSRVSGLRETLSAAVFQIEGPINVLASVVGMLGRRGGNDPAAVALAEALRAGQAALDTLRAAVPPEPAELPTAVNLNELLRDVLDLATGRLLAGGIRVTWRPQSVLPGLHGYPNRLRAMLTSLVDNAIEAMNVKGWQERELTVASRSVEDGIEIAIEDSGPGIPAELRLKAFEPFFTTKKAGGHLGTGLSSAQEVARDHGGGVELDPAVGGGCRVRVVLPLRAPAGGGL